MTIGFDNLAAYNQDLLLCLRFREGIGTETHDWAKPHHSMTLHGLPIWQSLANELVVMDYDANNPDWLDCTAAVSDDLDFTAADFSVSAWVYLDDIANFRMVMCRGNIWPGGGWMFYVAPTGYVGLMT